MWLVKRPAKGMLGGMRALPDDGWRAGADGNAASPIEADWRIIDPKVGHVFTHFSLKLSICCYGSVADEDALPPGEWWPLKSLDNAGLPTLFSKAARMVMAEESKR